MSTHNPLDDHPALEAALPLGVLVALGDIEHLTEAQRQHQASQAASVIAAHADDLMFRGKHTQQAFVAVSRALAILAFQPGGITFAGLHWCIGSGHRGTREQAPCAAELARLSHQPTSVATPPRREEDADHDGRASEH
ncbi:hypothetical protein [Amycolatopsis sp. TNS106]|uniref:hypothetical protein n=1 Tax=Amycolatopsis sp. TNS106 TaxID=2861750 RepID=UPI001C56912E|nr:hypothetical protein [Amycolatopsis sp. TNS106]